MLQGPHPLMQSSIQYRIAIIARGIRYLAPLFT